MKTLFISLLFVFVTGESFSQHEFMQWTSVGAEGKIIKKRLYWAGELDFRFGENGMETFFPQAGIEFKATDWCKASVEYRFIIEKNNIGNYKATNRLNYNLNFSQDVKRFSFGLRLRYQSAFASLRETDNYNADFDQAIRLKPDLEYDIDNSIFTPKISAEWFYNPSYGPDGPGFDKIRIGIGSSLELDGPHQISFKYQLDKRFHDPAKDLRHVLSIGYTYKL